jgi:TolB protein
MTRFLRAAVVVAASITIPFATAPAQDTLQQAVRLVLRYDPNTKPGVVVLRIAGAAGDSLRAILQRDFDYGDRINVIAGDEAGLPDSPTPGKNGNYPLFARLGAHGIVQATITAAGLHVALHDVSQQKVVRVRDFEISGSVNSREWRMSVHNVADDVEGWVTGSRGIAATRIAYIQGVRNGRLYVVDSDGAFPTAVGDDGGAMSPNWHPKGTHVAYSVISSTRGCCQIHVYDLASGRSSRIEAVGGGLNSTPVFAPDGAVIVYTHGEESGTDLFATTVFERGPTRRITVGRGSDNTSPTFSPDGRRLAFASGRLGHPEIYISDADGTNPQPLTYSVGDQNYRSNPDWSPDGRLVAYQSLQPDRSFQLNTISLRDRSVKQLTSAGTNEDPSWAPDSRHVIFSSTRTGSKQLFVIDTESGRWRQLTQNGGVRLPAWSPPLTR